MIGRTGIFPHNEYFEHSYALDDVQPQGMDRSFAIVLALDMSEQPFKRRMDYDASEVATDAEIKAFLARFKDIDMEDPGPLPLQVFDGKPLVRHTVENLLHAGVAGAGVVVDEHAEEVKAALEGLDVAFAAYDAAAVEAYDGTAACEAIAELACGQIVWAANAFGVPAACDSIIVTHADLATFEARHYRKLRAVFEERPQADFIPSYVEWRTTPPFLFPRRFLDELAQRPPATKAGAQGANVIPVRTYKVTQCMMGEEKLLGGYLMPQGALEGGEPESALPESALACVRELRREVSAIEAQERKVTAYEPEPALERGRAFLDALDASLEAQPIEGLEEAEAFATRNRLDFPVLAARENANFVYLDAAATALRPSCVIDACTEYSQHYGANIWRGMYAASAESTKAYQEAREAFAQLINADPRDCIFTANTSDALNLVSYAWVRHNVTAGDLVVVAANEHHSDMLPWAYACEELGAEVAYIPVGLDGRLDLTACEELLARKPKLVAFAHVSNIVGLENPVKLLAEKAHAAGACVAVDAAQSIPHVPIDVEDLGVDFLACSGHKMQGPTGIGVLWAHPDRVREMHPFEVGGGVISEVSYEGTYYRQSPYLFELGTPPIEQAIGLGAAAHYLQTLGMENIRAHARAMSQYALRCASLVPEIGVFGDHNGDDGALGLFAYTTRGIGNSQVAKLLAQMGIAVRAGAHCAVPFTVAAGLSGTTRVSFGPYTTKADIEAWGFAMSEIARASKGATARS